MSKQDFDLIIIGAGVLGSFHAYHACRKNLRVLLVEKDLQPMEATVRNFGQVVPSGMSQEKWQGYGRKSLQIYKDLQAQFDISVRQNGSIYIASDETELRLLHELADINRQNDYTSQLFTAEECLDKYPGLQASYCRGGLFFPEEITVEPSVMIHRLIAYMQEQLHLHYQPGTLINHCDQVNGRCIAEDSAGNTYSSDQVIICNGRDFRHLFPLSFYDSDIEVSKLQMMKTVPQENYTLSGSILTGLSIRRYESFKECPSFTSIKTEETNELFRQWGIHILFKQSLDGSIIVGDSHEYADAREQDQLGYEINHLINKIMLDEAKRIFNFPSWEIASSWNGYYAQSKSHDLFKKEVRPNIRIITAIGGKGMTASAGLAEEHIQELF